MSEERVPVATPPTGIPARISTEQARSIVGSAPVARRRIGFSDLEVFPIALSGNVFDALGDARFSRETYADGSYFGPAGLRFASLTIAGE